MNAAVQLRISPRTRSSRKGLAAPIIIEREGGCAAGATWDLGADRLQLCDSCMEDLELKNQALSRLQNLRNEFSYLLNQCGQIALAVNFL